MQHTTLDNTEQLFSLSIPQLAWVYIISFDSTTVWEIPEEKKKKNDCQ
jgi:hypothetical protein